MKTVSSLEDLSLDELVKIRSLLQARFGIGRRGNIIEVAFGLAEQNDRLDRSRPNAVCFYVRHKRLPRAKVDRIPERIELRLKRGRRFVQVSLPTDVIVLGTRQVRATGQRIVHAQSSGPATTGGVIAWRLNGQAIWNWGVLTVGHVLTRVTRVPESEPRVWIGTAAASRIRGTLIARSLPQNRDLVDAALVGVDRASLVQANLIPPNVFMVGKRVRSTRMLKNDQGGSGFRFPEQVKLAIRVVRFLPISELVPALGPLKDVVEAVSSEGEFGNLAAGVFGNSATGILGNSAAGMLGNSAAGMFGNSATGVFGNSATGMLGNSAKGVFGAGRSGSTWAVAGQAAAMQHGGLPSAFSRGWGQALESVLGWCVKELAAIYRAPAAEIDLRLIRVI